jgi:hypothetical protein
MRALPLAVFAACVLCVDVAPAAPGVEGARVVRGAGRFKTDTARDWKAVSVGSILPSGSLVESAADAPLEMKLPDGVVVFMEPGSLGRWMTPAKLPSETNGWTRGFHLVLNDGEADVRMPQGPKGMHAFLVSTTSGTLTDWRGKLHVMVHHDVTAAAIYEGALVVGSNGQGFPVYDGAGILLRKAQNPDKSRTIPPAPRWEAADQGTPSFAVMPGSAAGTIGFSWAAVQGAASYRIAVATDDAMEHVIQRAATSDTKYVLTEPSAGTKYFAEVRAVGSEGIVGEWSSPRPLRIIHYVLPAGAVAARDGAVVLPANTSLTLSDTDGVEVAYEDVKNVASRVPNLALYWAKLTGPLRLPDDTPMRIVHLRDASLGSQTILPLAHRELRAEVTLQPRNPAPGSTVEARIVVFDPSGRIDPASETVTVQATRNTDAIAVEWKQTGSTWTGRVPVGAAGVAVLRVVAKDSHGAELGNGFLELGSR